MKKKDFELTKLKNGQTYMLDLQVENYSGDGNFFSIQVLKDCYLKEVKQEFIKEGFDFLPYFEIEVVHYFVEYGEKKGYWKDLENGKYEVFSNKDLSLLSKNYQKRKKK